MSERKIKLQIKDMTKKYDNGDGVEHINLDVYEGEIVTFLGPSGCGKTTILRTIGGFLDVTSGDITIDGQSIVGLPQTGIVDYPTWYKVSEIYVAVSRIAELNP